jgi:hypothetical protein
VIADEGRGEVIHTLSHMIGSHRTTLHTGRRWARVVPAPFVGGILDRVTDAAAVLTGKAYAVEWPEPGELEEAIRR